MLPKTAMMIPPTASTCEAGGSGFESGASEPTVVELPGGRLWMLIRAQTGFLWQSFSTDRGQTWSKAAPSSIPSSNAPATMLRLRSGKIAVASDVDGKIARSYQVKVSDPKQDAKDSRGKLIGHGFAERTTFVLKPDGKVAAVIGGVSPIENVEQSLQAVQALAAKN